MGVSAGGRIWEELRKGATPEAVAREQEGILSGMDAAFTALDRLQTAALSFEVGPGPPPSPAVVCISGFPPYKHHTFAYISRCGKLLLCGVSLAAGSTMSRFDVA